MSSDAPRSEATWVVISRAWADPPSVATARTAGRIKSAYEGRSSRFTTVATVGRSGDAGARVPAICTVSARRAMAVADPAKACLHALAQHIAVEDDREERGRLQRWLESSRQVGRGAATDVGTAVVQQVTGLR